jgi:tetratricopeptide (TPR) repeat protein
MLGALAFKRSDCESAVMHFKQSWEVIDGRPEALAEYGDCLFRTRRLAEALTVFTRITELRPDGWHARYDLAVVQFRAGHNEEAIQTLRPLVEGPNPDLDALNLIAAAYEANRQTPLAVAALQRGIKLAPRDIDNYLDLATISLDHGSFQVGVDVLNAAIQANPDSAALYLERGVLLVQMLEYDEAASDFGMASKLSPQQNISTVALGISLLQHNQPSQSLQVVRARLQNSPNDPILNYILAEILLRRGVQPHTPEFQEALSAARRSIQEKPDFVLAHDVLSELYLRADMTQEAIAESRLALKADPDDQSALYHLIMALRKSGNSSEIPALVQRLAQATTSAREREQEINQFKLVETGVTRDKATTSQRQPD